jgi:hypothetical protein
MMLSFQQEFLKMIDHGDDSGPFGPRYTIVGGWRVRGPLDLDRLQLALNELIARHESLRTTPDGVQPPCPGRIEVHDLPKHGDVDDFLNDIEAGTFSLNDMPLLKLVIGRFGPDDSIIAPMAHHTAVDGWSAQVVLHDLAHLYASKSLPPARQYREYAEWQRSNADSPQSQASRRYWRETLAGVEMVALPTDNTRVEHAQFDTAWYRFLLEDDFRTATLKVAGATRSTPFMVLMAVYATMVRDQLGQADLVIPTFTPGRHPAWVQNIVGSFYNFIPLRIDISGCTDLPETIGRVRTACLRAYAHELTFLEIIEEAPDLMNAAVGPNSAACVFQVTQSPFMMRGETVGDLTYTAIRRRLAHAPVGSQIPDGALFGLELDPAGGVIGSIGYTTNLFVQKTIAEMVAQYRKTLEHFGLGR